MAPPPLLRSRYLAHQSLRHITSCDCPKKETPSQLRTWGRTKSLPQNVDFSAGDAGVSGGWGCDPDRAYKHLASDDNGKLQTVFVNRVAVFFSCDLIKINACLRKD